MWGVHWQKKLQQFRSIQATVYIGQAALFHVSVTTTNTKVIETFQPMK